MGAAMSDHYDERPHPINCCQAFDDTCPSCFWWDCATKAAEARIVAWLRGHLPMSIEGCRCGFVDADDLADAIEKGEHRERK